MMIPKILIGIQGRKAAKDKLSELLNQLSRLLEPLGYWQTDNLITFGKNYSFLNDKELIGCVQRHANYDYDKAIIWRTHILTWAARSALASEGDLVECGTHLGYTAAVLSDYLGLEASNRRYWCYDLFEGAAYQKYLKHGEDAYSFVQEKLRPYPFVRLIKGPVEQTTEVELPAKIAFLHLDLNSANAERIALTRMLPRLSRGAFVILDDYGWKYYSAQKQVADAIFSERNIPIVELPTGQGMAIIT